MKKTLTILATIILLFGCSTNPAGNENKAKIVAHIGTWNIYSDNTARWAGSNNIRGGMAQTLGDNIIQSTGDTITVNAPNLRGLMIPQGLNRPTIVYRDSTGQQLWMWGATDSAWVYPEDMYTGKWSASGFTTDGKAVEMQVTLKKINPDGIEPNEIFMRFKDSTHVVIYKFNISGIDSTLKYLGY